MKRPVSLDSPYGAVTLDAKSEGATQISALTPEGVFWALGWWQSSQRGDDALFARAFWRSQLSGSPHAHAGHAEIDAIVGSWQVDRDLDLEIEGLEAQDRARLHAFTRGFAAFQATRRRWPWSRPEFESMPWTAQDSVLLARTLGLASWWETRGALQREVLGWVQAGVDWAHLAELIPELGEEPDRSSWARTGAPAAWSDAAWTLTHRLHRWRGGVAFTAPFWGATYVCDVTEPGLPFLEVSLSCPGFSSQGLCLPGLPVLLSGRSESVVWHIQPSWGDIFHFSRDSETGFPATWIGSSGDSESQHGSSLGALMACCTASSAEGLSQAVRGRGAAALSLTALDRGGGSCQTELGQRWKRRHPRDAWLPSASPPTATMVGSTPEPLLHGPVFPSGASPAYALWQELLTGTLDEQVDSLLPELRFLFPETGDARLLKTWSGTPTDGPEALLFQRLVAAVWQAFWKSAGIELPPENPASTLLWKRIATLLAAPHSAWLPARQRNQVLGEAVRTELARSKSDVPQGQRRSALRTQYWEHLGSQRRSLSATVAITTHWNSPDLHVFHTDDEAELPVFRTVTYSN